MTSDAGKVFIGGVSWETTAEKLRLYFSTYGVITESVIIRDRVTGRGRGFGFVIFADRAMADKVVTLKHTIDGRLVEAKKAVPREQQKRLGKFKKAGSSAFYQVLKTKKIFVGGVAASTTEDDIRKYFSQFGTVTEAVVMCAHVTQKPRGFGFITFDSEDAVEQVLEKSFHTVKENEKMVEVKRAIPKIFLTTDPGRMLSVHSGSGGGGGRFGVGFTNCSITAPELYGGHDGYCYGPKYGPGSPTGFGGGGGFAFGMNGSYSGNGFNNSTVGVGYGSTSGRYAMAASCGALGYGSFTPGLSGYGIPTSPAWACSGTGFGRGSYPSYGGSGGTGSGPGHPLRWGSGATDGGQNAGSKFGLMAIGFVGGENLFNTSLNGYASRGDEVDRNYMAAGNGARGRESFEIASPNCDHGSNHGNYAGGLRGMIIRSSSCESLAVNSSGLREMGFTDSYKFYCS